MASQKYSYFPATSSESNRSKPAQTTDENGLKRQKKESYNLDSFWMRGDKFDAVVVDRGKWLHLSFGAMCNIFV